MSQNPVQIRAFEPGDLPQLTELLNQPQVVWGTLQQPFTSLAERQKRAESFNPVLNIVAEVEDRVVDCLSLDRHDRHRRAHVAGLGMAVHDAFAGQGYGTALLTVAMDAADRWLNLIRIELTVWPDNKDALRLYKRHGFVVEGTARAFAFRDGAYVDAVMMARLRLGPALSSTTPGSG